MLITLLPNVNDSRFGIVNTYQICRCLRCDLEQIVPRPDSLELKKYYETYYNFGGESNTRYTWFRERFLSSPLYRFWLAVDGDISFHTVKGRGYLLDIGCNEGRGLKIYQKNGFEVQGLELNRTAALIAREQGFTVYTQLLDQFEPLASYDIAVLSNVLEHSLDPKDMLIHVRRILRSEGEVWISCPNNQSWLRSLFGTYWINWHVPFHIVHFSSATLRSLLEASGFRNIQIKQETPALWVAQSIIAWLFSKPGKATLQLRSLILICFLMFFIRVILFPFLWLGNKLGRGDCLVVRAQRD